MIRSTHFAPRRPRAGLASSLAMAVRLAAGSLGASAMLAAPAAAQDEEEPKQDYSEGFVTIYQPLAEQLNAEGANVAAVTGQIPQLVAAVQTADDRFAAGNLILSAGNKANDPQMQRQGLELMVASGKADPAKIGQLQYFIGTLAFNAKDYAAARQALEASQAAGYTATDNDIRELIAETYFAVDDTEGAIAYIDRASGEYRSAGQQVPERWLLRSLQSAYDTDRAELANEIIPELLAAYPSDRNWQNSLQVVAQLNDFTDQQRLDLLRLMREAGALSERADFVRYIEAADPRVMSNEVNSVLAAGVAAGQLQPGEAYYQEVKNIADSRASQDRRNAPTMIREAQSQGDPRYAAEAGDLLYSIDDYAQAEAMYQLALEKNHPERDTMLTRLGISQAKQGKLAEAQASFDQVSGARETIAEMWSLYAQSRMQGGAATAQAGV